MIAAPMFDQLPDWATIAVSSAFVIVVALVVHRLAFVVLGRLATRTATRSDDIFLRRLRAPSRWLVIALALAGVEPGLPLDPRAANLFHNLTGIAAPALTGWLLLAMLGASREIRAGSADLDRSDNLMARRRRTRLDMLNQIAVVIVVFVTFCLMLMSIPAVRTLGVTLIASAGIVGLAVGAAAQPALKNLLAGLQMAVTQPIRLDDVVIIAGEWGRIEDIRLTYVIVKVWDERRLIVPISKFLEESFQNWTRNTSQLLGTAFLFVDPATDVPRLRRHLDTVVRGNPNWDGRVIGLQVTDLHADHMELRALVSSSDASKSFDLRCDVREAMMAFIVAEMPEALPRFRRQVTSVDAPVDVAP